VSTSYFGKNLKIEVMIPLIKMQRRSKPKGQKVNEER
jgi:hypothetical protein